MHQKEKDRSKTRLCKRAFKQRERWTLVLVYIGAYIIAGQTQYLKFSSILLLCRMEAVRNSQLHEKAMQW